MLVLFNVSSHLFIVNIFAELLKVVKNGGERFILVSTKIAMRRGDLNWLKNPGVKIPVIPYTEKSTIIILPIVIFSELNPHVSATGFYPVNITIGCSDAGAVECI